jgi:hypothetical protein
MARLADALSNIDFVMPLCSALDKPKNAQDRHELDALLNNTEKPIMCWAEDGEAASTEPDAREFSNIRLAEDPTESRGQVHHGEVDQEQSLVGTLDDSSPVVVMRTLKTASRPRRSTTLLSFRS